MQLKGHASAWPFLKPVDRAEVPDYYDHIKFPMGKFLVIIATDLISNAAMFLFRFEDDGGPIKKSLLHSS